MWLGGINIKKGDQEFQYKISTICILNLQFNFEIFRSTSSRTKL